MAEPVHHDELAVQMLKFQRYATALGVVLVAGVVFVALTVLVTNGTAKALKDDGDQRACVTDLRSAQAAAQGEELDYTLLALAASYRKDGAAADRYMRLGLDAADRRQAATVKLEPHNLVRLCPR